MGALDDLIAQTSGNGGRGQSLDELIAATSAPPEPQQPASGGAAVYSEPDPSLQVEPPADNRSWIARAQDADNARNRGLNPIERMSQAVAGSTGVGDVFPAAGRMVQAGGNALSAAAQGGLEHYREDPDIIRSLLAARDSGVASLALAPIGMGVSGAGALAQKGADRVRMAATNATPDDLRELGITARQFAEMTDRSGLNNKVLPVGRMTKLDRAEAFGDRAGQQQDAAVKAADAAGVGQYRDWGGEIARDVDQNADRVWAGGSGQRGPIVAQMRNVASAAEDHPMDSLSALRQYKTARGDEAYKNALGGLDESAAGKAALAASDSATQHLDNAMRSSGPENYQQYTNANRDFGDAQVLREMLSRRPPRANLIGDVAAGTAGTMVAGGNPLGVAAGIGARRVAAPYAADASANLLYGASGALGGAGQAIGAPAAGTAASAAAAKWLGSKGVQTGQQPANTQVGDSTATGHGNRLGAAADQLLRENPQAFGQWLDDFQKAEQEGSGAMSALVGRLMIDDPGFRSGPGLRLQQMSR